MFDSLRFVIVEDKPADRDEVLKQLSDAQFSPANKLGVAETYEEAKALLDDYAHLIDVVFLDLNIPRDARDSRPEKRHGKTVLDFIHNDLNRRAANEIHVIVVSGEDLEDGIGPLFLEHYEGTLVGIVQKAALSKMLKANLRRLKRDPLRSRILQAQLGVVDQYDIVMDPTTPVKERLKAGRGLVITLVQNEVDHHSNRRGFSAGYADDLNALIKDHIESRCEEDSPGKRRVKASRISTPGGWGAFLWRGVMVQHLYSVNSYRNALEHILAQPYRCPSTQSDAWTIPPDVLRAVESGEAVGKLLELTVSEILEWYLPWHEQVYLPWAKALQEEEA